MSAAEDKDLRAELTRVKAELESLEVFNMEQSAVGKILSAERDKLHAENGRLQADLLRILPLQCEKEKLRKTLEQTASELRVLSIAHADLLEQRKSEEARLRHLEEETLSLQSKEASLTAQLVSATSTSVKLQLTLDDSLAKLEAEAVARKASDDKVLDVSGELSLERAKTKSQAKEIERLLAIVQGLRQEMLVLKSRLSLREEALMGGKAEAEEMSMFHDAPSNPPPPPPFPPHHRQQWRESKPSAALFCLSPRSRCRKAFKQRSLAAQGQGQGQGQGQEEYDAFPFPQCVGFSSLHEEMTSAGCVPVRLGGSVFDFFRSSGGSGLWASTPHASAAD